MDGESERTGRPTGPTGRYESTGPGSSPASSAGSDVGGGGVNAKGRCRLKGMKLLVSLVAAVGLVVLCVGWDQVNTSADGLNVKGGTLKIDGTAVTATAAELNIMDGVTSTAAELNRLDTSAVTNGAAAGNSTAVETISGGSYKTVITLNQVLPLADGGFQVSSNIYTFPQGVILIEGAVLDATGTMGADGMNNSTADLYNFSVGTTAADNGDGTLSTTEVDVIPSTSIDTINGTNLVNAIHAYGPVPARHDGSSSAIALYASMGIPAANDAAANTNTITGTLTLYWKLLGDY